MFLFWITAFNPINCHVLYYHIFITYVILPGVRECEMDN